MKIVMEARKMVEDPADATHNTFFFSHARFETYST
jgi:hypothetical protein